MGEPETADLPLPALFIAGHRGLDFLNSIAVPVDEIVEWIADGPSYLSWLVQAGLLTPEDSESVRASMPARELNAVAAEARTLREWFRGFVLAHKSCHLQRSALEQLEPLIKILERDEMLWSIQPGVSGHAAGDKRRVESNHLQIHLQRRWRTSKSLLLLVAEQLAKLVCSADFPWIKSCEGPKCILFFLDLTRKRTRRWCSMAICGNRAKQLAHRKRSQGGHR